jgi:hypothetical protein
MIAPRIPALVAFLLTISVPVQAQAKVGASGRATTTLTVTLPGQASGSAATRISIDYGQPHARGRTVSGALAGDLGQVWRLGANEATTLRTDVDLTIGTITIPKGAYTLAAHTSVAGDWQLLVNSKTGQVGNSLPEGYGDRTHAIALQNPDHPDRVVHDVAHTGSGRIGRRRDPLCLGNARVQRPLASKIDLSDRRSATAKRPYSLR